MAQAEGLRHLDFYLYFQNTKLDPGKWTFWEVYISVGMWKLEQNRPEKGLDRIFGDLRATHFERSPGSRIGRMNLFRKLDGNRIRREQGKHQPRSGGM